MDAFRRIHDLVATTSPLNIRSNNGLSIFTHSDVRLHAISPNLEEMTKIFNTTTIHVQNIKSNQHLYTRVAMNFA